MPLVTLPAPAPYNEVTLNSDSLFAAVGDPADLEGSSDLLPDSAGGRSIFVTASIEVVGPQLGPDFVRFDAAAVRPGPFFVNRRAWVSLNPHPQVANVVQIHGKSRFVAVKGSMESVRKAFASLPPIASANKA
jgi:hypothetical protein